MTSRLRSLRRARRRRRDGVAQSESFSAWRRFLEGLADAAPARSRLRGPALGRRRPARLRRPARRLGARRAAARPLHGAARAARAPARLGRGQGERDHDLAAAARGRRDGAAVLVAARAAGAAGRDAGRAARARGRQPALRRAVRADARRARRRRRAAATRDGAGDHRRAARRALGRRRSAAAGRAVVGKVFWLGAVGAIGGVDRRAGGDGAASRSSARSSSSGRGARRSRARPSTRSGTCSCATSPTARSRARPGRSKHRRAAEWLEALGRPDDHAEMLAHHYSTALEYARAAGHRGRRARSAGTARASRGRRPSIGAGGLARGCSFLRRGARALAERRSGTPAAAFSPRWRARGLCRRDGPRPDGAAVTELEAAGEIETAARCRDRTSPT